MRAFVLGSFSEAVGACSIPVVIADGLTLPCAELVDWDPLVVRVAEAELDAARDVDELLARLPRDPARVLAMRASTARRGG